ncbi:MULTISPECIES: pseudouridine-5'-phosphate glycosidase [Pseudonocardia]|uniref:Pseudouridine-5'-phosphate glycosidase n=1 Tax=Pseudonocardia alni TaxID=33907 RepID=A0AA44UUA3_PSEA5|nr:MULTISPECIES: pseudouridine-5'-phosphate glycosidase [Pseudonocardia]MCO7196038.1 pseudouridine-5'-phosphate glycosidase [Pseudonocardia sp. McavD-2-B]MYW71532.1 pseudouridine-5-phosphate glycosidase [Pseudonocardia sp. SID8383]OJG05160.1 Pseudouridine-5'-phosphate glycosidase [Pseudonocardia autotrophica]PKB33707.1 pseudouridine-5'-phosphate glycosidase [Pseudonocardia alni]
MRVGERVADALAAGRPVLACESTIVTHGLPTPRNLAVAREAEELVGSLGVVPATIGVLDGEVVVGLTGDELSRLAGSPGVAKLSARDLPVAVATGASGGTTVAATAHLAHRAGIRVFATGGLGGVHRGAARTFDESADLPALAALPLVVVSAGVKSVLDVPATLERLETLGVTVAGYRTHAFPGFYVADSGHRVGQRVESPEQAAAAWRAARDLGLPGALLVANPVPAAEQLPPDVHDAALADALAALDGAGIGGQDATPFLLARVRDATGDASLEVNVAVYRHNVALGARIATALTGR